LIGRTLSNVLVSQRIAAGLQGLIHGFEQFEVWLAWAGFPSP
jgi:hypothetical protein